MGFLPVRAFSQQNVVPDGQSEKRIFYLIANYRTSPILPVYTPLTATQKFDLGQKDAFDRSTVVLAALVAGESQLTNADRSFGQGVEGYAHYFGTSSADLVIGTYLTEAVFPTILHQDPRYFRRGTGSNWSRLVYSAGETFRTHGDSGQRQFNFSEIAGNSAAVAISMAYYPDQRDVRDAASKFGIRIGGDMAMNIFREFGPDITRKFSRKHQDALAVK